MRDLFELSGEITLPERPRIYGRLLGNVVKQLEIPAQKCTAKFVERTSRSVIRWYGDVEGLFSFVVVPRATAVPHDQTHILRVPNTRSLAAAIDGAQHASAKWLSPRPMSVTDGALDFAALRKSIRESWANGVALKEEHYEGDALKSPGLRPPQIGALLTVKAHWIVSSEPATVVMPTGTGKTETMLALLVSEPIDRLLVVVPTDPLRTQVSEKFLSLGKLQEVGCLTASAQLPIVTTIKHAPKTLEEVDALFERGQVFVSTIQSISRLPPELQSRIADHVSYLFVDEAHHIGADTWKSLKAHFLRKRRHVLQFTATPYRNDDRRMDGKFVFVYPLRKAQEQHLFKPVNYLPIFESREDQADLAIIQRVGEVLDRDLPQHPNHIVMARTDSIDRAKALVALYQDYLPQHSVRLVHSRMKARERAEVLADLKAGRIRIVVCVNMLGEGFDLPQLKIAALHDRHQSEAVTIQFVGRFTRTMKGLGDATVIARIALGDPKEWLNALYREDADWNYLLRVGSASRTERQRRRENLYAGLDNQFEGIPTEVVAPRLSAFVFRTNCNRWQPFELAKLERQSASVVEGPIVNEEEAFAMLVMRHEDRLRWARIHQPCDVIYNLVMAHWDREQNLLYIHSSSIEGVALQAAKLVAGSDVVPLRGEAVFRVLHGFRRVMLTNLGVRETHMKPVRFQLSTGIDITEQLEATADNRSRIKTNLFGHGYVDEPLIGGDTEDEVSTVKRGIGCSIKGKVWSQEAAAFPGEWIDWCHTIGPKIANEMIDTAAVLKNIMRPKRQSQRPSGKVPLSIDWPEGLMSGDGDRIDILFGENRAALSDCDIAISEFNVSGAIKFEVRSGSFKALFELDIRDSSVFFRQIGDPPALISRGSKERALCELFVEDPPAIRFTDGDMLIGADLAAAPDDAEAPRFDLDKMLPLNWKGIDITKESQGPERKENTVQHSVIERLKSANLPYDVIFDGDASGEVADVVAIRRQGRFLDVELFHCKYSSEDKPGARIGDLYEVCGQAMKSVRWADPRSPFLSQMRRQEEARRVQTGGTRFEVGDRHLLDVWITERRELSTRFSVCLAQPGYSKTQVNEKHLPMLEAVRSYLMQTYRIGFTIWTSP